MVYTKEEFKRLWEANDNGSGITFADIADCAKAWGISSSPRTRPIDEIRYKVLIAAQVNDAEEYNPNPTPQSKGRIMIDLDKACEWLAANAWLYASLEFLPGSDHPQADVEIESLLEAFKQAMKEQYNTNKEIDMITRRRATADDLQKEYWLRQRKYIIWRTKDGKDIPIDKLTDEHLENILKMLNRSSFGHLEQTYIPEDLIGDYEDAMG